MSPELIHPALGFLLFISLLWGPTALWLVYRTWRGRERRVPVRFGAESKPGGNPELAADGHEALLDLDGLWVCEACRSLNRREVKRCYRCRAAKGSAGSAAPPAQVPLPVSGWIPVMADDVARPFSQSAGATGAAAALGTAPPTLDIPAGALDQGTPVIPPEAPVGEPVCPFLGLRGDPRTHFDDPHPGNACYATSERGATSVASLRWLVTGRPEHGRLQLLEVEHQRAFCLTAEHRRCSSYPAARAVAASR